MTFCAHFCATARLTPIGIATGGAAALVLTRLMSSMLFGVKLTDPLTFGGVSLLLCAIALNGLLHSGAACSLG